ncbi:MAG: hypothetical protein AB4040_14825 [Synechococcus sp.]
MQPIQTTPPAPTPDFPIPPIPAPQSSDLPVVLAFVLLAKILFNGKN